MKTVHIDEMEEAITVELNNYVGVTGETVKNAVKTASKTVLEKIQEKAPVETGAYRKSFMITKISETTDSMTMVVHSKNKYQLTHLLEKGYAKRGGGRVKAQVHIATAEKAGMEKLISSVERGLKNDS